MELYPDPSHYRSIVRALQYLTFTRPNLSYNVNFACQFLDYHYMHEKVALGALETCFVPSKHQLVDIFTRPLSKALFLDLRLKLGLVFDPRNNLWGSENITNMEPTTKSTPTNLERYENYCRIYTNRFRKLLNQLFHNSLCHIFHNSSL